jgi:hypothetical protein
VRLRRPGARSVGRIDTWVIEDGTHEVVKKALTDEELKLPIAAIWNHEILIQRVREGWNPLQEGRIVSDDPEAITELAAVSDGDAPHTILHYLYVPSSEIATSISEELRRRGFRTEERIGADGANWLVLARHEAVLSEPLMASTRRSMEALIAMSGGEYDGWEVDVHHQNGRSAVTH